MQRLRTWAKQNNGRDDFPTTSHNNISVPEAVGIDPDPLLGEMFPSERSSTLDKWFATKYGFVFLIRLRGISEKNLAEDRGHIILSDRALTVTTI